METENKNNLTLLFILIFILAIFAPINCISCFVSSEIVLGIIFLIISIGLYIMLFCWKKDIIKTSLIKIFIFSLATTIFFGVVLHESNRPTNRDTSIEGQLTTSNFRNCFNANFSYTENMTLTFDISPIYKEYLKNSKSSSIITLSIKYIFMEQ